MLSLYTQQITVTKSLEYITDYECHHYFLFRTIQNVSLLCNVTTGIVISNSMGGIDTHGLWAFIFSFSFHIQSLPFFLFCSIGLALNDDHFLSLFALLNSTKKGEWWSGLRAAVWFIWEASRILCCVCDVCDVYMYAWSSSWLDIVKINRTFIKWREREKCEMREYETHPHLISLLFFFSYGLDHLHKKKRKQEVVCLRTTAYSVVSHR